MTSVQPNIYLPNIFHKKFVIKVNFQTPGISDAHLRLMTEQSKNITFRKELIQKSTDLTR